MQGFQSHPVQLLDRDVAAGQGFETPCGVVPFVVVRRDGVRAVAQTVGHQGFERVHSLGTIVRGTFELLLLPHFGNNPFPKVTFTTLFLVTRVLSGVDEASESPTRTSKASFKQHLQISTG